MCSFPACIFPGCFSWRGDDKEIQLGDELEIIISIGRAGERIWKTFIVNNYFSGIILWIFHQSRPPVDENEIQNMNDKIK